MTTTVTDDTGEPTTLGQYVAFDVAATSPIQFTGLPPYQPGKVIADGETPTWSRSAS